MFGSNLNKEAIICTKDSPGQSVCQGDSGSALGKIENGRFVQYGIISFTSKSCDEGNPAGYSEISDQMDWILKNL